MTMQTELAQQQDMQTESGGVRAVIRSRRSRFPAEYTGARLDDEVVRQVLESANWAPTHKLTEPWRFAVYCDEALTRLFDQFARIYRETTPPERQVQAKIDKFATLPDKVSHVVALIMRRDPARRVPEIEEICAVACAVQNMHLALADFPGAGGYWSTGSGAFTPQMAEWLGLSADDRCLGFFYLGSVPPEQRSGRRGPADHKIEWVRN